MFHLFIELKGGRKRKTKRKKIKYETMMWNILNKDGIYCSNLKWICPSKEK